MHLPGLSKTIIVRGHSRPPSACRRNSLSRKMEDLVFVWKITLLCLGQEGSPAWEEGDGRCPVEAWLLDGVISPQMGRAGKPQKMGL